MSKALVTLATGPHEELLEIALPSFERFADRHGYDLLIPEVTSKRPPSWWKVPALRATLDEYDEALWVDADVVIVNDSEDLPVEDDSAQALVAHHTRDGEVPNLGVWFVRREMRPLLDKLWTMVGYIDHVWWEQAGMCELLGYGGTPLGRVRETTLFERTQFLGKEWNPHINDPTVVEAPRFRHATMLPDRAAAMREWAGDLVAA